jgi:hypothetical protein
MVPMLGIAEMRGDGHRAHRFLGPQTLSTGRLDEETACSRNTVWRRVHPPPLCNETKPHALCEVPHDDANFAVRICHLCHLKNVIRKKFGSFGMICALLVFSYVPPADEQ